MLWKHDKGELGSMRYFAAALFIMLLSVTTPAQESVEYRACQQKAETEMAMNACASDEASRADAQLNDVYRALLQKVADPSCVAKIKAAERAWIAYRDALIDAMYPAEDKQVEYGSVYLMEVALLRAELTRLQIDALQDLLQQYAVATQSLPKGLASILQELKAKTRVPILLPGELPAPIGKAEHTVVEKASANEYAISLYYELGIGDAGFAASFDGDDKPEYSPRDLPNVDDILLAGGRHGSFRPVSCGGSCAPANLWWQDHGVLYQIQLVLPYGLSEESQKKAIVAVVDSAILAGPR